MNITYLTPTLNKIGGPNRVLANILDCRENYEDDSVSIICLRKDEDTGTYADNFLQNGIQIYYLEELATNKLVAAISLRKLIKQLKPDIIHSNTFKTDLLHWIMPRNVVRTSTAHNVPVDEFVMSYGWVMGRLMSYMQIIIYKRIDRIIAVSQKVSDYFFNNGIMCQTVYNGVPERGGPLDSPKKLCKIPNFVWTGRLIERKNLKNTLTIFADNREIGNLHVVGEGPLLESFVHEFGKYENIFFEGHAQNVDEYLDSADAFISPSLAEGLPMASLEALASGLPLILSDIPSHREISNVINNDDVVTLFDLEDIDSEMMAIKNARLSTEVSMKAREYHLKFFSSKNMAQRYAMIFRECYEEKRGLDEI